MQYSYNNKYPKKAKLTTHAIEQNNKVKYISFFSK